MSQKRKHDESRPTQEEESPDAEAPRETQRPESAEKVSKDADDMLLDIDDALDKMLLAPGEKAEDLDDVERERRTRTLIDQNIQKGGQ